MDYLREQLELDLENAALKTHDPINHPMHYTKGKVECIDALASATIELSGIDAVCTANAIKYLWRWKHKNGIEDLRKAKWYIDHLISSHI
jgi:hypothetical protein